MKKDLEAIRGPFFVGGLSSVQSAIVLTAAAAVQAVPNSPRVEIARLTAYAEAAFDIAPQRVDIYLRFRSSFPRQPQAHAVQSVDVETRSMWHRGGAFNAARPIGTGGTRAGETTPRFPWMQKLKGLALG